MNNRVERKEAGQSLILVTFAILVLFILIVLAVDIGYAYVHRRSDQNSADAAALAGARKLAAILNANEGDLTGKYVPVTGILKEMNRFAEQNGVTDTGGSLGDAMNSNVWGYFLDANGQRIGTNRIDQLGLVHPDAQGVEAIVQSEAPSFFGGVVGLDGLMIGAESAVTFQSEACAMTCIAPIATQNMEFIKGACYNIWDGARQTGGTAGAGTCTNHPASACAEDDDCDFKMCKSGFCKDNGAIACTSDAQCVGTCNLPPLDPDADWEIDGTSSSSLGWLNWSMQGADHSCQSVGEASDCSQTCQEYNLRQGTCLSGRIAVGSWVAGTAGVKNSSGIRADLNCYMGTAPTSSSCPVPGDPITVIIYDTFMGNGCNQDQTAGKQKYHVVGFAKFKILGYELAQGGGSSAGHDGAGCLDYGMEGNRITGEFISWVDGEPGDCTAVGTIIAPRVVK